MRFIPACAGNTRLRKIEAAWVAVHPRVRGEHGSAPLNFTFGVGSSPRARGTHIVGDARHRSARFIPACAGNTWRCSTGCRQGAVHPRVRGEHPDRNSIPPGKSGSSPRARGTRRSPAAIHHVWRFIPACAGNTCRCARSRCCSAVHPRVRGEHPPAPMVACTANGSSPRARGTPDAFDGEVAIARFIPACAGNTLDLYHSRPRAAVHPRVRGEHACCSLLVESGYGSSPRARGTPPRRHDPDLCRRFIPACAGNTFGAPRPENMPTVHPRVRGEHMTDRPAVPFADGSSPRARGTHTWALSLHEPSRFIPACAGNTRGRAR